MNREQLQRLAIQTNVRHNELTKHNNDDYSSLSFAIAIVLIILFISFVYLLINL